MAGIATRSAELTSLDAIASKVLLARGINGRQFPTHVPGTTRTPPPAHSIVHPYAVRLLDTLPPPPPTSIEAYALDPADPTVLKDAAYHSWHEAVLASAWYQALSEDDKKNLIGLRVRWLWTAAHMRQAPDTREFRIYYQPDQVNVLQGTIRKVTASSGEESEVETDIPNAKPAETYRGLKLNVGADGFQVVSSQASDPLRLTVKNIGPKKDIRPPANTACSLPIPSGHPDFVDYSRAESWWKRYYVVDYEANVTKSALPAYDAHGHEVAGSDSILVGSKITLQDAGLAPDLSTITLTGEQLYLEKDTQRQEKTYFIIGVDDATKTVTVNGTPDTGGASSAWKIVYPLRTYEIFLPPVDDAQHRVGIPLTTSLERPIRYAQVGVSAADDKAYVSDKRQQNGRWGNRTGNEGFVGARATIFRVRREPPPPPPIPIFDSDKVYATHADYHNRSYYTYRWVPATGLKTHIFRALDDTLLQVDWSWRKTRQPPFVLLPNDVSHVQKYFPPELRKDDAPTKARREDVASKLNDLNNINPAASMDEIRAKYQALTNDALRVLAGLPDNDDAFTQLTIQPLDPQEPDPDDPTLLRWRNRVGPDNRADFVVDAALRVYIDTLDGRSTNRYFYRAGYVDGAHNRSEHLSLSSPPVYCPDVVPPRAPTIIKVLGGDRQIILRWVSNREPDVTEYRVYRAASAEATREVRLMKQVGTVAVDPVVRPETVQWSDKPVPGLKDFWYCVVAVDRVDPADPAAGGGNVSEPSAPLRARAACLTPPPAPTWVSGARGVFQGVTGVVLSWNCTDKDTTFILRRRRAGTTLWTTLAEHIEFDMTAQNVEYVDATASTHETYEYVLLAVDPGGNRSGESALLSVPPL